MLIRVAMFVVGLGVIVVGLMSSSVSAQSPGTPTPPPTPMIIDPIDAPQIQERVFKRHGDAGVEIEQLKAICNQPTIWSEREQRWGAVNCHTRRVVQGMMVAAVAVGGFGLIWGAMRIITEGGDPQEAGKGLRSIWGTLFGVFLVGMALTLAALFASGLSSELASYMPWSPLAEVQLR